MKTIICDIDGVIFKYSPKGTDAIMNENSVLLPGVKEQFNEWEKAGHKIILITGRRESVRNQTEFILCDFGIPFDVLLMGYTDKGRVLINDVGGKGQCKAHAVSIPRDEGFEKINWSEVKL